MARKKVLTREELIAALQWLAQEKRNGRMVTLNPGVAEQIIAELQKSVPASSPASEYVA